MEELHIHCLKCVNRRCMIRPEPSISCDLMGCPLVCGAVFHSCKLNEHRLLCPYERVPCLNHGFGCPFTLARVKIAQHLETCPASVVCCTMEWNRWPVSYADRKSYDNLSKEVCDVEQLDMALALQDQRMLLESLKVATTVTKALEEQNQDNSSPQDSDPENELIETDEEPYGGPYTISVENSRSFAATLDVLRSAKNIDLIVENPDGEEQNGGCNSVRNGDGDFSNDTKESDTDSDSDLGAVGGADCPFPVDPEDERDDWLENSGCGESSEEEGEMNDGIELSGLHNEGNTDSQVRLERVNASSNVRQVLLDHSIPVLAREPEMAHLPQLPLPLPIPVPNLMHNNVLHHLPYRIENRWLERKLENLQVLRGMNLFTINGRRTLFSDPYLFKAKMEDKAVDTSDLEVADDPMGLHGIDLITAALLFCLGDSPGGRGISDSRFVDGYRIDIFHSLILLMFFILGVAVQYSV
ncbi:F-box only protein 30-like [Sinocyclocheilus grahami]|uniref:F-box only protein 30-like n=1 Tax=Sinocyclocheilus grahami TaxID=75366 RepID=A0A672S6X4_SINGR|nr:PREDICTED: F-box only protein 30-like [Sinocyclocheilus grahami]